MVVKQSFCYLFSMLIRLCFFHIFYKPHSNYFLSFLAERFGNLLIIIRRLFLMIYKLIIFTKRNLNFELLSLNV